MGAAGKRKGSAWERVVVEALRPLFPQATRALAGASDDRGDVANIPLVVECKNQARLDLAGWLSEAHRERDNHGVKVGVVWFKRRGKASAEDGYVLMDGATFLHLLSTMGDGR